MTCNGKTAKKFLRSYNYSYMAVCMRKVQFESNLPCYRNIAAECIERGAICKFKSFFVMINLVL